MKRLMQEDRKQRRPFPSEVQEQNLPSPNAIALFKLTICTLQIQLGFFLYQCAISGKEQPS